MEQVFLARHGETEWNRIRRRQGQLNSPLTRGALAQSSAFILQSMAIRAWYDRFNQWLRAKAQRYVESGPYQRGTTWMGYLDGPAPGTGYTAPSSIDDDNLTDEQVYMFANGEPESSGTVTLPNGVVAGPNEVVDSDGGAAEV